MKTIALFCSLLLMSAAYSQQYDLSLNLEKGKEYLQVANSSVSINQTMGETELAHEIAVGGHTAFLVKEVTPEGYLVEVKYRRLWLKMNMATYSTNADTETPDAANPFSAMLASLVNKPFTMTMTKKGKITSVTGIDALFEDMVTAVPGLDAGAQQKLRQQLRDSYGEKAFRTTTESTLAFFPDNEVGISGSWNRTSRIESGIRADFNATYSLKEAGDAYYLIEGFATIQSDKEPVSMGEFRYVYDISGNQRSQIRVDAKSGWVIEVKIRQEMHGSMEMTGSVLPEPMLVPMQMTSSSTISNQ